MKPRTSSLSFPKSAPDKKAGTEPYAAIPAWAEKVPTHVETGDDLRPAGTHFQNKDLARSGALDPLAVTQQFRGDAEQFSAINPMPTSIHDNCNPCSTSSVISLKVFQGPPGPLLTVKVTANILAVSEKTIRRLIDRGDLAAVCIGRSVRIRPEVLAAYIDGRAA